MIWYESTQNYRKFKGIRTFVTLEIYKVKSAGRWSSWSHIITNVYKVITKNWRDHCTKGTSKHTETYLKYFDGHKRLSQSEENESMWTHNKDGVTREFLKGATRGLWEEWKEGNLKGNYLRLILGLCLEDRTNW